MCIRDSSNIDETEQMRKAMQNGESGAILFYNQLSKYVYYEPTGINDWYLLTVVPQKVVTQQTNAMLLWSYGFIALFVVLLAFLVI